MNPKIDYFIRAFLYCHLQIPRSGMGGLPGAYHVFITRRNLTRYAIVIPLFISVIISPCYLTVYQSVPLLSHCLSVSLLFTCLSV